MFKIGDNIWFILGGLKYEGSITGPGFDINGNNYKLWKIKLTNVFSNTTIWKDSDLELQRKAIDNLSVNESILNYLTLKKKFLIII